MRAGKYVLHSLKSSPTRTALGTLSIVTMVFLMISIGIVFSAGNQQFTTLFTTSFAYDIEVTKTSDPFNVNYINATEIGTKLEGRSGMTGVYPLITTAILAHKPDGALKPYVLFAAPQEYQEGTVIELEGEYDISGSSIVASREAAAKNNLSVGSSITVDYIISPTQFVQKRYNVSGIIDITGRFSPSAKAFFVKDLPDVQEALGRPGECTSFLVKVDDSLYDLQDVENPVARVETLAESVAADLGPQYHVYAMKAVLLKQSYQASGTFGSLSYVFSIILPAIAGILIASILNLSVEEKAQDMGTLRLIGARRSYLAKVVLLELGALLLAAFPLGVALALLATPALVGRILSMGSFAPVLRILLTQIAIALAVIVAFSVQPLLKAFNTNPIDAVRRTKKLGTLRFVSDQGIDRRLVAAGLLLFVIVAYSTMVIPYILIFSSESTFIFFVMISVFIMLLTFCIGMLGTIPHIETALVLATSPVTKKTNKLTRRNLRRYARRNISTNIIFGVIVGILIFTATIISGIRISAEDTVMYLNGADVRVSSASSAGIPLSDYEKIASRAGVAQSAAGTVGLEVTVSRLVEPSGTKVTAYGIKGNFSRATYLSQSDFYAGSTSAFERLDNESVIISRNLAIDLDVSLGDRIAFRNGNMNKFVKVTGILGSLPGYANEISSIGRAGSKQACFVSVELFAYLQQTKGGQPAVRYADIFIKAESGADPEALGSDLQEEYSGNEMVFVSVTQLLKRQLSESLSFIEMLMFVLTGMLMIVAVFSLMTNLYASVREREYEIGVLKAVGLRNSSIVASILTESVVIALASLLIGIAAGLIVGFMAMYWIGVLTPIGMVFAVPFGTIVFLAIATAAASLIAGYFPARSVAKKDIIGLMRKIE